MKKIINGYEIVVAKDSIVILADKEIIGAADTDFTAMTDEQLADILLYRGYGEDD
ncbi:MAG: hypothetical protein E6X17_07845 [Sporomusaceae bacterium]|nr:hypothetical protein [Sporomusaceae bacterium]